MNPNQIFQKIQEYATVFYEKKGIKFYRRSLIFGKWYDWIEKDGKLTMVPGNQFGIHEEGVLKHEG